MERLSGGSVLARTEKNESYTVDYVWESSIMSWYGGAERDWLLTNIPSVTIARTTVSY